MPVTVGINSYGDEDSLQSYADLRGMTITGDKTVLLIKAMDWLEIQPFSGRKYSSSQPLEFPRSNYDIYEGDKAGVVPDDIKTIQFVAALLIDSGEDLNPIVEPRIKKERVDVISVEYADITNAVNIYPRLTKMLSRFLKNTGGSFEVIRR